MGTVCVRTAARAALVAVVVMGAPVADAEVEPVTVPLLLVDAPAGFDAARFATALETYVPGARIVVSVHAAAAPAVICADAQAAAAAAHSPIGLWARWAAGSLVIERVGEGGCGAVDSSVVDVAPDQQVFLYRVAALKVASLVREVAPVAEPVAVVPAPVPRPIVREPAVRVPIVVEPPVAPARVVELGASGIAGTSAADRVLFGSLAVWVGGPWAFGGTAMVSVARDETGPAGRGSARVFGGFAGVRRAITRGARWELDVTAELGVLGVGSVATRTGTSVEMSERVWTPAVAVAPRIRLPLAGPLALAIGPTLEASSRPVRLTLGDTALYNASRLRLRLDVRAELRF